MTVVMFAMLVLGGALAGWLAGFVMERGGHGLKWDIILGLSGSAVASSIVWILGGASGVGLAGAAVVGAVLAIVAQRKIRPATDSTEAKVSLRDRWREARPTKTAVFWSLAASVVATMIIGFTWGGWVTGSTARQMAQVRGENAVVKRLAPMCVVRFNQDLLKAAKLKELKETSRWAQTDYVIKQGWATMPGEYEPESRVAEECGKLLMLIS